MTKVLEDRRKGMLATMDKLPRRMLAENSTVLGRRWLSVIPFNKSLKLTDYEVSAALHYRTLHAGSRASCHYCSQMNALGHDDVCEKRPRYRVARHELLKCAITDALECTPVMGRVTMEPYNPGTRLRTDIRIEGSRESGLAAQEFDITVVSLATQEAQAFHWDGDRKEELQKVLEISAKAKRLKYACRTASKFRPLVFSIGGAQEAETLKVFEEWQKVMGDTTYSFLCRRISLMLLRARVKYFIC